MSPTPFEFSDLLPGTRVYANGVGYALVVDHTPDLDEVVLLEEVEGEVVHADRRAVTSKFTDIKEEELA